MHGGMIMKKILFYLCMFLFGLLLGQLAISYDFSLDSFFQGFVVGFLLVLLFWMYMIKWTNHIPFAKFAYKIITKKGPLAAILLAFTERRISDVPAALEALSQKSRAYWHATYLLYSRDLSEAKVMLDAAGTAFLWCLYDLLSGDHEAYAVHLQRVKSKAHRLVLEVERLYLTGAIEEAGELALDAIHASRGIEKYTLILMHENQNRPEGYPFYF
jgi:hypothetical protein